MLLVVPLGCPIIVVYISGEGPANKVGCELLENSLCDLFSSLFVSHNSLISIRGVAAAQQAHLQPPYIRKKKRFFCLNKSTNTFLVTFRILVAKETERIMTPRCVA